MDFRDQKFRRSPSIPEVVRFVCKHEGHTSREIAALEGLDKYAVAESLLIAKQQGLIKNGLARQCNIQNVRVATWWPANE
ncbi:hypothetical protein [Endozoicomonas montiporae]|uniref:Uncharacterized protein n=1 Tax=Endozoicomonas montiporae CL-33 TaxID=570277 RepID=A0A142BHK5_9GAMM|nr:hypothetical protein [Endozoicomonas montiporae]AMO58231.1 hypothetical protein EZMO1_4314 [Endozoicomonas montiporae CL-33]